MAHETKWLADFRRRLEVEPAPIPTPTPAPAKSAPRWRLWLLCILLPLIAVSVYGAKKAWNYYHQPIITEEVDTTPTPIPQSPTPTLAPPQSQSVDKEKLTKLEKDMDVALGRLSLVGGLLNQNTYVIANGLPPDELVYIDGNWKINKLPSRLTDTGPIERFLAR